LYFGGQSDEVIEGCCRCPCPCRRLWELKDPTQLMPN
jgi:hypothetical protein